MKDLVLRDDGKVTRVGAFIVSATGLVVDGDPSFEDYERFGQYVQRAAVSIQWILGDWLNYGESKWGEKSSQAMDLTGMHYDTLAKAKQVAQRFEHGRRRPQLDFTTHREVAFLPPADADAILDRAEAEGLSTRDVRALVRELKSRPPAAIADDACTVADLQTLIKSGKKFGTIYADPPWAYENQATRASTDNHYQTMTIEDIAALPIGDLAADRSHLWLWTTNGFLFECPKLFEAWGFEFKSSYVWVKPQMGIGNYLRNSHELLLLAVRGGLTADSAARDVMSWGQFDRAEHSAKPERIRVDVIERISPSPRLELFGRKAVADWVVWGNQIRRGLFDDDVRSLT